MIDENLTWKNRVNKITNKLSKIIGILHRLKYIYPKHILLTIYNSLIIPHVNFGSLVRGTTIERISKLQKKATLTITHSHYIAHTELLMKDPLPLPVIAHTFAESSLVFQLVKMKNNISVNNNNNNNIYSSIALISSSTGTCSVRCIKLHMFKTMQIKNNIHNNNKHNNTVMIKTET